MSENNWIEPAFKDETPRHHRFSLLHSGRRYRAPKACNSISKNIFYPRAITKLNSNKHCPPYPIYLFESLLRAVCVCVCGCVCVCIVYFVVQMYAMKI